MIKERRELLTFGMGKLFKKLAIPSMFWVVIAALYNLTDAFFVWQYVWKEWVWAIALVFSAVLFNTWMFSMIWAWASSVLSISIWKNDKETIHKLLFAVIISVFISSGIFSLIIYFFTNEAVVLYWGIWKTHTLAVEYLKILSLGFIFAGLWPATNYLNRWEWKMKQAMIILSISWLLNVILDPILINYYGFWIKGAAYATVISQLFFVIIQFWYFVWWKTIIKFKDMDFRVWKKLYLKIFKIGFSHFIMSFMSSIQMIILFQSLKYYGWENHVSLMWASYRIFMFMFMVIWWLWCWLQPIVWVNYWAWQYSRIKKAFLYFKNNILYISVTTWILFMIFPDFFLSLFITEKDFVKENVNFLRILFWIFFLYAYQPTIVNLFLGLAKAKEAAIMMFSRQVLFFIPLVLILPLFFWIWWVWIALPIWDLLALSVWIILKNKIFKNYLNKEDKELKTDKHSLEANL